MTQKTDAPARVAIGLHIPKCGGSTVLDRVRQCLPRHQIFQNTSIIENYRHGLDDFLQINRLERLRFLFGHTVHEEMLRFFGNRPVLLFTGVRSPIARMNSALKYMIELSIQNAGDAPDLDGFVRDTEDPMCWFIIGRFPTLAGTDGSPAERAIRVLQHFDHVYVSEDFENTIQPVFDFLGIRPEPVDSNLGSGNWPIPAIDEQNLRHDIELYEFCRQLPNGRVDVDRREERVENRLRFMSQPPDLETLRQKLYSESLEEYQRWGCIEDVMIHKRRLIDELHAELAFYEMNQNNQ